MSLNRTIVMGRLTRDPELRRTNNGTSVTSFSIAVDRDFKAQDGSKETDFIDVVAWRHTAEFVSRYFAKGRMAVVDGRLQTRSYQDKTGNKRTAVEVVADNVYFGDSKNDAKKSDDREAMYDQFDNNSAPLRENNAHIEDIEDDGDLPF